MLLRGAHMYFHSKRNDLVWLLYWILHAFTYRWILSRHRAALTQLCKDAAVFFNLDLWVKNMIMLNDITLLKTKVLMMPPFFRPNGFIKSL